MKTIFGVLGEENAELMITLANHSIEFITCAQNKSQHSWPACMVSLLATPGICLATLGPGVTSLITGIGLRIPFVVIV